MAERRRLFACLWLLAASISSAVGSECTSKIVASHSRSLATITTFADEKAEGTECFDPVGKRVWKMRRDHSHPERPAIYVASAAAPQRALPESGLESVLAGSVVNVRFEIRDAVTLVRAVALEAAPSGQAFRVRSEINHAILTVRMLASGNAIPVPGDAARKTEAAW